ncbi:MAG: hypothetical protein RLZZ04_3094 [Cyanobacteriota bacterium]|jgi:uncharacterized metal-binding protein
MPSGVVHDRITICLLPWVAGITYFSTRSAEITLVLSCGYLFSGMMFGPDLDIYSLQYKRWGIMRFIWLPYRKFLRHRSLLSHGLILGTCVRLLYLFTVIFLLSVFCVAIAQLCWGFNWNWQVFMGKQLHRLIAQYPHESIALLSGLELGAMSHSLSDWINSYRKHRRKSKLSKAKTKTQKSHPVKIYQKKK